MVEGAAQFLPVQKTFLGRVFHKVQDHKCWKTWNRNEAEPSNHNAFAIVGCLRRQGEATAAQS